MFIFWLAFLYAKLAPLSCTWILFSLCLHRTCYDLKELRIINDTVTSFITQVVEGSRTGKAKVDSLTYVQVRKGEILCYSMKLLLIMYVLEWIYCIYWMVVYSWWLCLTLTRLLYRKNASAASSSSRPMKVNRHIISLEYCFPFDVRAARVDIYIYIYVLIEYV